jgi:hypothetical protein
MPALLFGFTSVEFPPQPGANHGPFSLDGSFGHFQHFGHFVDLKAAVKPQFDHFGLLGVEFRQLGHGIFKGQQILVVFGVDEEPLVEFDSLSVAASFFRQMSPGVIDEYAAHCLGTDGEEVRSPLPVHAFLVDELEIGLVNQGRGLKGMVVSLPPEITRGELSELIVYGTPKPLRRVAIPVVEVLENSRQLRGMARLHCLPPDLYLRVKRKPYSRLSFLVDR